jgi:colanic acid/amylovoran biosynthesis protein
MNSKSKSITIVHGLPDTNSGGSALGVALVNVLKRKFDNPSLTYISSHTNPDAIRDAYPFIMEEHSDLEIIPYPVFARADNYNVKSSFVRKIVAIKWILATLGAFFILLFPFLARNKSFRKIKNSSLLISRGTNIFYDKKGQLINSLLSKFWLCIPLLFAWRVKVPFVIYAQTIGPIHSRFVKMLMKFVLKRATIVLPREQYSYDYLRDELRIPESNLVLVPDSVFGLEGPANNEVDAICKKHSLPKDEYSCLVVRHYMEKGSEKNSDQMFESLISLSKHILKQGISKKVVVVTQCHDLPNYRGFECDSKISQQLFARLKEELGEHVILIDEPLSPHEAMCIYGGSRYLISVRLHAAIFAMIVGTPAIAVSYWGSKTRGIFEMLGFENAFVEKEDLTGPLLIEKLTDIEDNYKNYLDDMMTKVESAYDRAQKTPETFADLPELKA